MTTQADTRRSLRQNTACLVFVGAVACVVVHGLLSGIAPAIGFIALASIILIAWTLTKARADLIRRSRRVCGPLWSSTTFPHLERHREI